MARATGNELLVMVDVLEANSPDFLLLLGDRGEMLAGAIAALHLNIPIMHLHRGKDPGLLMSRHDTQFQSWPISTLLQRRERETG